VNIPVIETPIYVVSIVIAQLISPRRTEYDNASPRNRLHQIIPSTYRESLIMVRDLGKLATILCTAIDLSPQTEEDRVKANMVIFCASLLVVFVNAKLELYFFDWIMTGSHFERQLAETTYDPS
jgi:hypothetical protein